ncbi:MAG: TauD/TfdA family dioxygenase [Alphaproteobacteria bacterium]|nr:TauD/TfdA family dioxygenase [Alphaproteobacteria bacterium]
MSLTIDPLHPHFVAEVSGVDLTAPMSDEDFAAIRKAIDTHAVLVFRGQDISDAQQVAFSERFGKLEQMLIGSMGGGTPIADLSNVDPETDEIIPPDDKRMIRNACNMLWHTDSSFKRVPSKFSILSGREVPEADGPTEFASMRAAYAALPEETKQRIEGLVAIHSFAYSRSLVHDSLLSQEQKDEVPPVKQVLVRQNPENGRKSLYLGSHAAHVIGMPVADGRALLRELLEHATQPQFVHRHDWRPKDLVIWDNRSVLHRARPWDFERGRRVMHRTTVAGDGPSVDEPTIAGV